MFADTSSTMAYSRYPPTPPHMGGLTLPSIKHLDLPLITSRLALPSPPLTPTTQCLEPNHGKWLRATSPAEGIYPEALTELSRSALYRLEPVTDCGSQKHDGYLSRETLILSNSPQLPSISEFMREVHEMKIAASLQWNHGISRPPTPPLSPGSSSDSSIFSPPPDDEQRVPWSRARFPSDDLAAEFFNLKVSRDYELRKREHRRAAATRASIQRGKALPVTGPKYRSNAGVKKTTKQLTKEFLNAKKKRNNTEYSPTQECFIIYHKSEKKLTWNQIEKAYEEFNVGHPHRTWGALSCCYYRTNSHIPLTTPDGLLVLRWDYGKEAEMQIQEDMEREQRRLDEEYEKVLQKWREEVGKQESGQPAEDEDEDEEAESQEEEEEESQLSIRTKGSAESEDGKNKKKTDKKGGQQKKKAPKRPTARYPFSIHGDDGIPTVEYMSHEVLVQKGGDVNLFQRFPEVLADERNTWVSPEDREKARDIAARRMQQRLEWREWMKEHHPQELAELEQQKKGSSTTKKKKVTSATS